MNASALTELLEERSHYDVDRVSKKRKLHRFKISYGSHRVWLQERANGAAIQLEVDRTPAGRRSTETTEWTEALTLAEAHIYEEVRRHNERTRRDRTMQLAGGDPELLRVIQFYRDTRYLEDRSAKHYVGLDHRKRLDRVWAIVERHFALRRPTSEYGPRFAERYIEKRTQGATTFPEWMGRRPCGKVRVRTAVKELKDFSGVLAFAVREKVLGENPLEGYDWDSWLRGDVHAVEHMEEAHTKRHQILMAPVPGAARDQAPIHRVGAWDGGARLRLLEALLFHHAHRVVSCLELDCGDVAFDRDEVTALLAPTPNHREWWAEHWPHGAIIWRRSKVSFLRVTPMGRRMRAEMDRAREWHPDWRPGMPVFTQQRDPTMSLWYDQPYKWMIQAIGLAKEDLRRAGVEPDRIHRWMAGAPLHGWRDHWATLMDRLGWGWDAAAQDGRTMHGMHNHVAFLGDWKVSGGTQAEIYAKLDPRILLAAVEFAKAADVVRRFSAEAAEDVDDVLGAIYRDDDDAVVPIDRGRRA